MPLKKVDAPKDESEIGLIEITSYLSLQMERTVVKWLHGFISEKLERDQFGGTKGHSVAHYVIEVMNFVLFDQDLSVPVATMITSIDIHKGFNKVEHKKIITILAEVMIEGACRAHRVGYSGFALICRKLLPKIESK